LTETGERLHAEIAKLREAGLNEEEALLIAGKRLKLSHSARGGGAEKPDGEAYAAVGLAVAAGMAVKLPMLFGIDFGGSLGDQSFYLRNISLLILPLLASFFAWKREAEAHLWRKLFILFGAAALLMNLLSFPKSGSAEVLAALHLPIALWFVVGIAYTKGDLRNHTGRMSFIRFSGEWFIYLALIALGGGVFIASTMFIFQSIGIDAKPLVQMWILPCGVAGAVVIAGWLADSRQGVAGSLAPILTRLFTPLFTLLLLGYLAAMGASGQGILADREALIGFDLLLALIVGLSLYAISSRDPVAPPGWFDRLQIMLIASALVIDILALKALSLRISEFGISPNKAAALGENLLLLIHLSGSAMFGGRFLFGRGSFAALERWQTTYLPAYLIWAIIVTALFPLIFRY